jgi:3-oxoacyl-(acyl-carrier-protein) synthase
MNSLFITGAGINTQYIPSLDKLKETNIDLFSLAKNLSTLVNEPQYSFKSKSLVSREDRSLLNFIAKLSIDSTAEAFLYAQDKVTFTDEEKENFPIFIGNESVGYDLSAIDSLMSSKNYDRKRSWNEIGCIKKYLNPLEMLRLLSTNPLYHLSKMFGLTGGGYPFNKMSLSGLAALETSLLNPNGIDRALVVAAGDMTIAENLATFTKMNLIKNDTNSQGIIPSYGSASIIIEKLIDIKRKVVTRYAEIISVKSHYKYNTNIDADDWKNLHSDTKALLAKENVNIILYQNGVSELGKIEEDTMRKLFLAGSLYSYKKYIGYTGKANNLIDLVISLADRRIPLNSYILINGIGTSVGIGYILIKKLNHL